MLLYLTEVNLPQACTILLLPDEVTLHLLQYLPGSSLPCFALACRQYCWLVKDMLGTQKLGTNIVLVLDTHAKFSESALRFWFLEMAGLKLCVPRHRYSTFALCYRYHSVLTSLG